MKIDVKHSNERKPVQSVEPARARTSPVEEIKNGNSGGTIQLQSRADSVGLSPRANAIRTNEDIHSVVSDILGPKSTEAKVDGPTNGSDPAASFRSETKQPLEGFDHNKLNDPKEQTPKYLFGRVAQDFKLDSVTSLDKAEELLKAMVPDLKKKGLEVVGVEGDRIQVKTGAGYEWIDVIRGAGADRPGWQWAAENKGTQNPTKTSKEWGQMVGGPTAGSAPAGAMGPAGAGHAGPSGPIILGKSIDGGKVLSILKRYSPTGQGLTQAANDRELQNLYPGVKTFGGWGKDGQAEDGQKRLDQGLNVDMLVFPNGAVVDVITNGMTSAAAWGWQPTN